VSGTDMGFLEEKRCQERMALPGDFNCSPTRTSSGTRRGP
jgi:hypothetical protein